MNKENPDICPIRLYYKVLSNRPAHILTDRFFLTPIHFGKVGNQKDGTKICLSESTKFLNGKILAKKIGLDAKSKKNATSHIDQVRYPN